MNSRDIEFRLVGCAFLGLAFLFIIFPQADLAVASLFRQNDWQWLLMREHPLIALAYRGLPLLSRGLIIMLLVLWLGSFIKRQGGLRARRFTVGFLLAAAMTGPVLIVDAGLKNHIGRARPAQTDFFGGTLRFSPAFMPSDQCQRNCSFVSGHVASTAFIMAFGWLSRGAVRRRWLLASVGAAGLMGFVRMSVGGHFLSDCIFAWFACYFGLWLTEWLFARLAWHRETLISWRSSPALPSWAVGLPFRLSTPQQVR